MTYTDEHEATGNTWLGEVPIPPMEEIASQSEFVPKVISQDDSESLECGTYGELV